MLIAQEANCAAAKNILGVPSFINEHYELLRLLLLYTTWTDILCETCFNNAESQSHTLQFAEDVLVLCWKCEVEEMNRIEWLLGEKKFLVIFVRVCDRVYKINNISYIYVTFCVYFIKINTFVFVVLYCRVKVRHPAGWCSV